MLSEKTIFHFLLWRRNGIFSDKRRDGYRMDICESCYEKQENLWIPRKNRVTENLITMVFAPQTVVSKSSSPMVGRICPQNKDCMVGRNVFGIYTFIPDKMDYHWLLHRHIRHLFRQRQSWCVYSGNGSQFTHCGEGTQIAIKEKDGHLNRSMWYVLRIIMRIISVDCRDYSFLWGNAKWTEPLPW